MQLTLTTQRVIPIVRAISANSTSTVLTVETEPLTGGTGEGLGLYRVSGTARVKHIVTAWSVVLKILSPATSGQAMTGASHSFGIAKKNQIRRSAQCQKCGTHPAMTAWNYWRREAHIYESGLLTTLPGLLTTPRCYGVEDQEDGTCWIWLEDLGPATETEWNTDHYWHAAHHLGQLNGHYLAEHPLPEYPWFNRTFLPQWLDRAPGMNRLDNVLDHPLVRRLFPEDVVAGYRRLWAMREALLARLARLPQTFCHLDAFPGNLIPRQTATGTEEFVAIDWAYAGIDALGAELAPLIFARVTLLDRVDLVVAKRNADAAVAGYLAGLATVGWQGDPQQVRMGYLATALLRFGIGMVPVSLNVVTNPRIHEWAEPVYGYPIEEMIDYWVAVARWRLALMEELLAL